MKNHLFHRLYLSLESVHNTSLVGIIADKTKKAKEINKIENLVEISGVKARKPYIYMSEAILIHSIA